MKILVTGSSGFIGFSVCIKLLMSEHSVVGIDNNDNYYSVKLKNLRLKKLLKYKKFKFLKLDITQKKILKNKISKIKFDYLYHFAAQPGVRYSLKEPKKYYSVNVIGFQNILDTLNISRLKKVIYASSSSVYGDQMKFPVNENAILKAKNPYGLSKIINEQMAEIYNKIFTHFIRYANTIVFLSCATKNSFFKVFHNSFIEKKFYVIDSQVFPLLPKTGEVCLYVGSNKKNKNILFFMKKYTLGEKKRLPIQGHSHLEWKHQ